MFIISSRSQWITKGTKSGSKSKETDNNPGSGVSLGQLQSDQLVLVPKFSGKLTSARILDTQVMADHFIDLAYMYLTISTIHNNTLAGKSAFERWDAIFGV